MNVEPIGERVLIKHLKKKRKTESGIYIPESAQEEKQRGEVVAVGEFENGEELPLKKGDKVIYGGYSSEDVTINGEDMVFVDFEDVLAKLN